MEETDVVSNKVEREWVDRERERSGKRQAWNDAWGKGARGHVKTNFGKERGKSPKGKAPGPQSRNARERRNRGETSTAGEGNWRSSRIGSGWNAWSSDLYIIWVQLKLRKKMVMIYNQHAVWCEYWQLRTVCNIVCAAIEKKTDYMEPTKFMLTIFCLIQFLGPDHNR